MRPLGLSWTVPQHRRRIGEILGEISRKSTREKGVLLSILVHGKGTGRPGPGFFTLALEELGYRWDNEDDFVAMETERVFAAYAFDDKKSLVGGSS